MKVEQVFEAFMDGKVIRFNKPDREHRMWIEKDSRYRWSTREGNDTDTGTGNIVERYDPGIWSAIEMYIEGGWQVSVGYSGVNDTEFA